MISLFALAFTAVSWCPLPLASLGMVTVTSEIPLQGDPLMVVVSRLDKESDVIDVAFDNISLPLFSYEEKPTVLYGIDLEYKKSTVPITVTFADGTQSTTTVHIIKRKRITAPLPVPEKLGGNTKESQQQLVASLANENSSLALAETAPEISWTRAFMLPLASTTVTDTYGYSRLTGDYTIPHKGVDFRAKMGTPVFAVNDGIVRIAREYRVYGKTVVIDHGLGLMTFSMHLSEIKVKEGEKVSRGEEIALSGNSGYAESPHLHLSVRIGGIAVDPLTFFSLFGEDLRNSP